MKYIISLITVFSISLASCSTSTNNKSKGTEESINAEEITVIPVDSLLNSPEKYIEKTISVSGLVVHTCRNSGKKMFLVGEDKDKHFKVIAGNNISRFDQSLEGETVIATGKLTLLDETQEKHNEEKGEQQVKTKSTSSENSSGSGCAAEANIKNYQMICDSYKVAGQ